MKEYIETRVKEVTNYILENHTDIRKTARVFGVSKSTVHKDVKIRLKEVNPLLCSEINTILEENKILGEYKGGAATARLYSK